MNQKTILGFVICFCGGLVLTGIAMQFASKPTDLRELQEIRTPPLDQPLTHLENTALSLPAVVPEQRDFVTHDLSLFAQTPMSEQFLLFNRRHPEKLLLVSNILWSNTEATGTFLPVCTLEKNDPLLDPCGIFLEEAYRNGALRITFLVAEGRAKSPDESTTIRLRAFRLEEDQAQEVAQMPLDLSAYLKRTPPDELKQTAEPEKSSTKKKQTGPPTGIPEGALLSAMTAWRVEAGDPTLMLFLGRGGTPNLLIQCFIDFSPFAVQGKLRLHPGGQRFRWETLQPHGQGYPTLAGLHFQPHLRTLFLLGAPGPEQNTPVVVQANFDPQELDENPGAPLADLHMGRESSFLLMGEPARRIPASILLDKSCNLHVLCRESNTLEQSTPFFYRYLNTQAEYYKKR